MDIGTLIPQLFYDLIGRVIPGATLLASTLFLYEGPDKAIRHLAAWSNDPAGAHVPTTIILLGNLLAAHVLASLLGGLWFRLRVVGRGKYLTGLAKRGELRFIRQYNRVKGLPNETDEQSSKILVADSFIPSGEASGDEVSTDGIAYMYDYVLLHCPKAGARIAKLRAEQHMSGVLSIGFLILAAVCYWFPFTRQSGLFIVIECLLITAVASALLLAWHLEKRCNTALINLWLLVSRGADEK